MMASEWKKLFEDEDSQIDMGKMLADFSECESCLSIAHECMEDYKASANGLRGAMRGLLKKYENIPTEGGSGPASVDARHLYSDILSLVSGFPPPQRGEI